MDTTYIEILGIRNFLYLNAVKDISNIEITIEIVKNYIDFYNNERIRKKLNGLSPVEY